MSVASNKKLEMGVGDYTHAFLDAELSRPDVFVRFSKTVARELVAIDDKYRPFLRPDNSIVVRLKKALYGLKESSMEFYKLLAKRFTEEGFTISETDAALFLKQRNGYVQVVGSHVDDIFSFGSKDDLDKLQPSLGKKFTKLTFNRVVDETNYLGMTVRHDKKSGAYFLSQPKHIDKLVESLQMEKGKSFDVPFASTNLFSFDDDAEPTDSTKYRSLLMLASYIANTRVDIRLPIAALSTRMENPTKEDFLKLVRLIKYLNGTRDREMKILAKDLQIYGSADASFGVHGDGKSQSGYLLWVGTQNAPFLSASKKQTLTTRSSTEAELVALSAVAEMVIPARRLMEDLGIPQKAVCIEQDNQSSMMIVEKGPGRSAKARTMRVRISWLKELVDDGIIKVQYVPSEFVVADGLTKPLSRDRYLQWRNRVLNAK